jgi:hypothetical protein
VVQLSGEARSCERLGGQTEVFRAHAEKRRLRTDAAEGRLLLFVGACTWLEARLLINHVDLARPDKR